MRSRPCRPAVVVLVAGMAIAAPACTSEPADPAATSDIGSPSATRPPALGAELSLDVGETRRIQVDAHCGVEALGVSINGQTWRAIDLADTDADPSDPIPSAWRRDRRDQVDLFVTLRDATTLEAAPWDSEVTVTYSPDPDFEPGPCD